MRIVGVAVLALGLGALGGAAQEPIRTLLPQVAELPNLKADALRRQAELLYERPRSYRRAAALHEKEAQLRSVNDTERVNALAQSARLYAYVGDLGQARALMERAARSALQRGDVMRAAHALLDAAFLAIGDRDLNSGYALARQAGLLSQSPLLSEAERNAIVRRIDPAQIARSNE
jgi:hypothetical protein